MNSVVYFAIDDAGLIKIGSTANLPKRLRSVGNGRVAPMTLIGSGVDYVLENVVGARRKMAPTLLLHGGMFGLGVHRPRLFESHASRAAALRRAA